MSDNGEKYTKLNESIINTPEISTVVNKPIFGLTDYIPMRIDDIGTVTEPSFCVTKAQVINIAAEDGWFKNQCCKCEKNIVYPVINYETQKVYRCEQCGIVSDVFKVVRYEIGVKDLSGTTSFVIFETQLAKMLNQSVAWLHSKMDMADDPTVVPDDFAVMLNKEYVFRVRITGFILEHEYSVYLIDSVTDDADTILYVGDILGSKYDEIKGNKSNISSCDMSCVNDVKADDETTKVDVKKRKSDSPADIIDVESETSTTKIPKIENN